MKGLEKLKDLQNIDAKTMQQAMEKLRQMQNVKE
jgi:hypothetical protein